MISASGAAIFRKIHTHRSSIPLHKIALSSSPVLARPLLKFYVTVDKISWECLGGWNDANPRLDVPCHALTSIEPYKNMLRCYVKSPTVHVFWPVPGLISCAGVIGRWGLLSCSQNAVRWLALSKRSVEAPLKHVS